MTAFSDKQLLQFAIESGMLDASTLQKQAEMNEKRKYLEMHPYSVTQGRDGYWRTYIPTDNGRRQIKKKTEEAILDVIIEFWEGNNLTSFKARYDIWVDRQSKCGRSGNTINRYKADYKRFFEGRPIEKIAIEQIDDEYISEFILTLLNEKDIPYRALKALYGYFNGVFEKAVKDRQIVDNPCKYVDLPIFRQYCVEKPRNKASERTISDEDRERLYAKLKLYETVRPSNITKYAIELSMYTGMRCGELSALTWSNVDFQKNILTISKAEVFDRQSRKHIIRNTKNHKIRFFPITDDIKELLLKVKKVELENGFLTEYVFSNEKGRIHAKTISEAARKMSKTKEFDRHTSIHELRRTLNSNLRCMGVSATTAGSLIGNTERVNEENYTYDTISMREKMLLVEKAGRICVEN